MFHRETSVLCYPYSEGVSEAIVFSEDEQYECKTRGEYFKILRFC